MDVARPPASPPLRALGDRRVHRAQPPRARGAPLLRRRPRVGQGRRGLRTPRRGADARRRAGRGQGLAEARDLHALDGAVARRRRGSPRHHRRHRPRLPEVHPQRARLRRAAELRGRQRLRVVCQRPARRRRRARGPAVRRQDGRRGQLAHQGLRAHARRRRVGDRRAHGEGAGRGVRQGLLHLRLPARGEELHLPRQVRRRPYARLRREGRARTRVLRTHDRDPPSRLHGTRPRPLHEHRGRRGPARVAGARHVPPVVRRRLRPGGPAGRAHRRGRARRGRAAHVRVHPREGTRGLLGASGLGLERILQPPRDRVHLPRQRHPADGPPDPARDARDEAAGLRRNAARLRDPGGLRTRRHGARDVSGRGRVGGGRDAGDRPDRRRQVVGRHDRALRRPSRASRSPSRSPRARPRSTRSARSSSPRRTASTPPAAPMPSTRTTGTSKTPTRTSAGPRAT